MPRTRVRGSNLLVEGHAESDMSGKRKVSETPHFTRVLFYQLFSYIVHLSIHCYKMYSYTVHIHYTVQYSYLRNCVQYLLYECTVIGIHTDVRGEYGRRSTCTETDYGCQSLPSGIEITNFYRYIACPLNIRTDFV